MEIYADTYFFQDNKFKIKTYNRWNGNFEKNKLNF